MQSFITYGNWDVGPLRGIDSKVKVLHQYPDWVRKWFVYPSFEGEYGRWGGNGMCGEPGG